jgi:hypothetical protein
MVMARTSGFQFAQNRYALGVKLVLVTFGEKIIATI